MGCVMAAFGLATEAWGLVFKNLVSDVGATIFSMNKYGDPPLPTAELRRRGLQDHRAGKMVCLGEASQD
jgi:hypothetical protein